jgi:nitroreductase
MATQLPLTLDELLTTTRSVRRRLDLTRPVEREVIEECLALALQAPTGGNIQNWHFMIVTDPSKRAALAELYRKGRAIYVAQPFALPNLVFEDPQRNATQARVEASSQYLNTHLEQVPVHVIPCITGRTDGRSAMHNMTDSRLLAEQAALSERSLAIAYQSAVWGSIAPAAWSFMLAARARGLGTCWTSLHLLFEEEAALLLGIPYAEVMQACLIPVAYTKGTEFKPARREPMSTVVHWESW